MSQTRSNEHSILVKRREEVYKLDRVRTFAYYHATFFILYSHVFCPTQKMRVQKKRKN